MATPRAPQWEDPLNIDIRTQPLAGPALVRDYLSGEGTALSFYAGSPESRSAFAAKWDEIRRRFGPAERERAARALRPTSARAGERLERFVREGGAVVTTGQQAGILTGPLFTIYKALTAARLAEALETELGITVLPVFWTASEDHDWAEVNHAFLLDGADEPRRIELPSDDLRALPMSERKVGKEVKRLLDEVSDIVRGQAFDDYCLRLIEGAYQPGRTVADGFSAMVADLLAPFDVLLADAADIHLKEASTPVLRHALSAAGELGEILAERGDRLLREGYHAQVAILEGATNVFYHGTGERERIDLTPGGFVLHETRARLDSARISEELEADSARFSPNVLLRPVVESAVFPALAYVAGPGEISYFAQASAIFPEFGMQSPVVFPRASATLVEPSIQRLLDALELDAADLTRPRHELATSIAREAVPAQVRAEISELARSLTDGYRRLIEEASHVDPTLRGTLGALRNESLARVAEGERKIVNRMKDREAVALARLDRVRAHLRPFGQSQERVLNVIPFLAAHGPELLQRIYSRISVSWAGSAPAAGAKLVPDSS